MTTPLTSRQLILVVALFSASASTLLAQSSGITVSPATLNFSNIKAGLLYSGQSVAIRNASSAAITIRNVSITGPNASSFLLFPCGNDTVAPGNTCSLQVNFTTVLPTTASASLVITTDDSPAPTVVPIAANSVLTGSYELVNAATGKLLEVQGAAAANGIPIQENALNGMAEQQWRFVPVSDNAFKIQNVATGKVLDVTAASKNDGALIQQWDDLGTPNQQWQLSPVDDVHYKIINVNSGKVLDIPLGSARNGSIVQQWEFNGNIQQLWALLPKESFSIEGQFAPGANNSVANLIREALDVTGSSAESGTLIQQWAFNAGRQQQWQFLPTGGGYYAILNRLTGKVLDVKDVSTASGALVQQYDFTGGLNQQWQFLPLASGNYEVINRLSGKALDAVGGSNANGTLIQQYDYLGFPNQKWFIQYRTPVYIVNEETGLVLDLPGGSPFRGTPIQQWTANGGQQQQWQAIFAFLSTGFNGYIFVNDLTGKALEPRDSSGNAIVQQNDFSGALNQLWLSNRVGVKDTFSVGGGGSLSSTGSSLGTLITIGGPNIHWMFAPVPD